MSRKKRIFISIVKSKTFEIMRKERSDKPGIFRLQDVSHLTSFVFRFTLHVSLFTFYDAPSIISRDPPKPAPRFGNFS